jgi:response regulator RpfG family c-di-GMP phosphodiesterase
MAKRLNAEQLEDLVKDKGFSVLGVFVRGAVVREYAVADHLERTAEYAESFAKKVGGTVGKVR